MTKKTIGNSPFLHPMPVVLVGTKSDGKPNYMTAAYAGVLNREPPIIGLGIAGTHLTAKIIEEKKRFSINIPSEDLVIETDHCGLVSGKEVDKSQVFTTFYGEMEDVPMIEECPVCFECTLYKNVENGMSYFAEIQQTHVDEEVLTDGSPDIAKVQPLIYSDQSYWKMGEKIGDAFSIGKKYNPNPSD